MAIGRTRITPGRGSRRARQIAASRPSKAFLRVFINYASTTDGTGVMLTDDGLDLLFRKARSHNGWLGRLVPDDVLRQLYELMKWGATSANSSPARIVFLRTPEAKERLRPALSPGNIDKVMTAPVTAIVAYDLQFYRHFPKLFPHNPAMQDQFASAPDLVEVTARRNSSLQGA